MTLSLLLVACTPPEPPKVRIEPQSLEIEMGNGTQQVVFQIVTESKVQRTNWEVTGLGRILGDSTQTSIEYQTPETVDEEQTVTITVEIKDENGETASDEATIRLISQTVPILPTATTTPTEETSTGTETSTEQDEPPATDIRTSTEQDEPPATDIETSTEQDEPPATDTLASSYETIADIIAQLSEQGQLAIAVGYSDESGPYSYNSVPGGGNSPMGYEIALLQEMYRRWTNGKHQLQTQQLIPINVVERIACADAESSCPPCPDAQCDLIIGAITHTENRCNRLDEAPATICTTTRHGNDRRFVMLNQQLLQAIPNYESIAEDRNIYCEYFDEGKAIGVIGGTTADAGDLTKTLFAVCINREDMNFENIRVEIRDDRDAIVNDIVAGTVIVGYFTDGAILKFYAAQSNDETQLQVVDISAFADFPIEDYIYLLPETHAGLRDLIDLTLRAMNCDYAPDGNSFLEESTYDKIYAEYEGQLPDKGIFNGIIYSGSCETFWNGISSDVKPFIDNDMNS